MTSSDGGPPYSRRHRARGAAIALLSLAWLLPMISAPAAAQTPPALTAPVNDFANVIDPASERELERRILALQKATTDVIVVATVPTFKPAGSIEEYAVKMFENGGRGIGVKGKDNGLLILVAVEDRRVKIEVGYGLEGYVTDGYAGQTIRELMLPAFKNGQYGQGLVAGTTRLINRIAEQQGITLTDVPAAPAVERPRGRSTGTFPTPLIIFLIILILMMSRRRRRRRHWGVGPWSGWNSGVGPFGGGSGGFGGGFGGFGGGGGGGFGGFGGGRSGGGGASGGW
ncbi:MAG TPA: TPM domain-containing protein [Vicinamibacterales bacterium]|nr:TPM domain-containing protein [Vicinamibacterales bacterium]